MMKKVMFAIAMLAVASYAGAASLNADGLTYSADTTVNTVMDRLGLVNDGSFEFGECDAGSAWTCTTNTSCAWIIDPSGAWGYAAYDGVFCAWLGGFCGSDVNANSFCQDIYIDGGLLDWYWMGYVGGDTGNMVQVTANGNVVWSHVLTLADHTYGLWQNTAGTLGSADVSAYCSSTVNLCLEAVPTDGANMLVDYVELGGSCDITATDDASISTVKALY